MKKILLLSLVMSLVFIPGAFAALWDKTGFNFSTESETFTSIQGAAYASSSNTYFIYGRAIENIVFEYSTAGILIGNFSADIITGAEDILGMTYNDVSDTLLYYDIGGSELVFETTLAGVYTGFNFSLENDPFLGGGNLAGLAWNGTHYYLTSFVAGPTITTVIFNSSGNSTGVSFSTTQGSGDLIPIFAQNRLFLSGGTVPNVYEFTTSGIFIQNFSIESPGAGNIFGGLYDTTNNVFFLASDTERAMSQYEGITASAPPPITGAVTEIIPLESTLNIVGVLALFLIILGALGFKTIFKV